MWNFSFFLFLFSFFFWFQPAGMDVTSNELSYCYIKGYKLNSKKNLVKKEKEKTAPVTTCTKLCLACMVFQVDDGAHKGWIQNYKVPSRSDVYDYEGRLKSKFLISFSHPLSWHLSCPPIRQLFLLFINSNIHFCYNCPIYCNVLGKKKMKNLWQWQITNT